MTLEDFEKSLADSKRDEDASKPERRHKGTDEQHRGHHHSHHRSHHLDADDSHRHKRRRQSRDGAEQEREHRSHRHRHEHARSAKQEPAADQDAWVEKDGSGPTATDDVRHADPPPTELKRDAWMEAPSALDFEIVHRRPRDAPNASTFVSAKADFEQKIRENELSQHHLQDVPREDEKADEGLQAPAQHAVDYTFGDAGAQWRMLKLKAVYRQAAEAGQSVEEAAMDKYGDLRAFDDAREEEVELERRDTYGEGYVGKEKPSGELFQERKLDAGVRREAVMGDAEEDILPARIQEIETLEPPARTIPLDQTALNKLKAQMMKAKLRGATNAPTLEAEYSAAMAAFANRKEHEVVVLGTMDNRMLAGGRQGEVKDINTTRGRERGLVEENEDMSIEDMVREERRTRGQAGGEGQRFAERIAKDGKFDVRQVSSVVRLMLMIFRTTWTIWTRMPTSSLREYRNPRSI